MTSAALDFTYRYPFASGLGDTGRGPGLELATCGLSHDHPHFFEGRMRQPRVVGDMLLGLSDVVRTHFFLPRPPLMDPVITSSESMLRLEGFSGCCGVYARVDLPAEAFDQDIQGRGTTNVDFNNPLRATLTRLRDRDEVRLAVGRDKLALTRGDESVLEKKVKLPIRWIKGFSEVQAYQPGLCLAFEVSAADARPLLRSLPQGGAPKRPSYVVRSGRALRISQRESPGAVRVSGLHRLRILQTLLAQARFMRIWTDADTGISGWEIVFDAGRFFLMLSPEIYRGFSGEGQVLETLAGDRWKGALSRVRAQLAWQAQIDVPILARQTNLDFGQVEASLAVLGSRGLAGYDVTTGKYFHRELPFDLEQVEALQPRLQNARRLLAEGGVRLAGKPGADAWDVSVQGTDVAHHVRLRADGDRCTCPWFSRHQGARGPCKHMLAARLLLEDEGVQDAAARSE